MRADMKWLRLYVELLKKKKVHNLTDKEFRVLINLWCAFRKNGHESPSTAMLAHSMHWTEKAVERGLEGLAKAGFLDEDPSGPLPHGWRKRQPESEISTTRVRAFRERQRNVSETVVKRFHPVSETDMKQLHECFDPVSEPQVIDSVEVADTHEGVGGDYRGGVGENLSLLEYELPRSTESNGSLRKTSQSVSVWFEESFWKNYPRKVQKKQAIKAAQKIAGSLVNQRAIIDGLAVWNVEFAGRETDKIPYPATFLNSEAWREENWPVSRQDPARKTFDSHRAARESAARAFFAQELEKEGR